MKYFEVVKMPFVEAVQKVLSGDISTSASIIGILMIDMLRKKERFSYK